LAFGFVGKIARVDLTNGKVKKEPIDEKTAKRFVGCVGYAAKILWDELKPGIDPLGPENKLIMATGPLTGTLVPNSGSYEACFKSPLTGVWAETRSGGRWGSYLKYAGYDMLILEGKSEKPVYLTVLDGEVEIRPADKIWGKTVPETEAIIKEEIKTPQASVASIGVAGENKVKIACIMNDLERAAGRCGGGAVMGSKNVKAIATYGHGDIAVAKPHEFMKVLKATEENIMKHPGRAGMLLGTIGAFTTVSQMGDLPTKYGWSGCWDKAEEFYDRFLKTNYIKNRACWTCMLACGRYSESKGKWPTIAYGGPEYETAGAMSAFCLIDDNDALIRANYLCNIHGLDTISAGHMVAFAMQCYEKGLITKEDTDGIELTWGNAEALMTMLERIAKRQGFGDVLAEGIRGAAQKIGKNAIELALQVKGLDMPMHDPRAGKSLAVQYGTANRGMCHIHPQEVHDCEHLGADWDLKPYGLPEVKDRFAENRDKAFIAKLLQDFGIGPDILGTCKFPQGTGFRLDFTAALLSAATGWQVSDKELLKLGERVINLQRCFNVREGLRRKDDMIPPALRQPHATGTSKGVAVTNYEAMLDDYYDLRGWDKQTGIPTRKTLKELELTDIADDLAKHVQVL
jgi:aldehyde:ferredoxin oxidoreductase